MQRRKLLLASLLFGALASTGNSQATVHTYSLNTWTTEFGLSVAGLGDLDGDGLPEAAIGQSPIFGVPGTEGVAILRGGTGLPLRTFFAPAGSEWYGYSLAAQSDLNGDGLSELLIGAPGRPANASATTLVEVRDGASGALLHSVTGPIASGFGTAVLGLDDVDGDGVPDFAVGAPLDSTLFVKGGAVYVHSGATGALLRKIPGTSAQGKLGRSLASLPDQENDGSVEILAGAPGMNTAFLFSGASGSGLQTFSGSTLARRFGYSVAAIADVDGDALPDVLIGDPGELGENGPNRGSARVHSNASAMELRVHKGGFWGDYLGHSVLGTEDLDFDGVGDYVIGIPMIDSGALFPMGFIRAHSGATGQQLFSVSGPAVIGAFGFAMDNLGDFDGDGFHDIVVGAPGADRALVIRAAQTQGPGTPFCYGDGSAAGCPCGNLNDGSLAAGRAGCSNSASTGGASMSALGTPSVAAANLQLVASGLVPGTPGLYFQGTQQVNGGSGQFFGDGLRCAGGPLIRMEVVTTDGAGHSGTLSNLSAAGAVQAGDFRTYQLWFRDPVGSLCGTGFNLSNGVEVLWEL